MTPTARLAPLKPSSCRWLKATADGEWLMERSEDDGTTWLVAHQPDRTVVADYLGSLVSCRLYIGSGQAREDFERIRAAAKGEGDD